MKTDETEDRKTEDRREELLPCPFCGGDAITTEVEDLDEAEAMGFLHICGCHNLNCPAMPTAVGMTAAEAAKEWNTRKGGAA